MRDLGKGYFVLAIGLLSFGCADNMYQVVRIPDSASAMEAYRACSAGSHRKVQAVECLNTIPGIAAQPEYDNDSKWKVDSGCRYLGTKTYKDRTGTKWLLIEACGQDPASSGPPPLP
jgi:hypothetical protein